MSAKVYQFPDSQTRNWMQDLIKWHALTNVIKRSHMEEALARVMRQYKIKQIHLSQAKVTLLHGDAVRIEALGEELEICPVCNEEQEYKVLSQQKKVNNKLYIATVGCKTCGSIFLGKCYTRRKEDTNETPC